MTPSDFAKRLRKHMATAGMQPRDLAYHADTGITTIYRYLAGERLPNSAILHRLADVLQVSADELLGINPVERLEAPSTATVKLPLLLTIRDVAGEAAQMVEVPEYALPVGLPHDVLAVVVPDEAAPDLRPDDLVIVARRHEWSDGDLLSVIVGERLLIRHAYHEPDGGVLVIGRDATDRARIAADAVVGRVMTYTRSL